MGPDLPRRWAPQPARHPDTAGSYLRWVLPALRDWSSRYDHLREITHGDVLGHIQPLHGDARRSTVTALRSLFTWVRRAGVIFGNPATQIQLGKRENQIWQLLTATDISETVTAAKTPPARLCIVLAAGHAARSGQIRAITLDDVNADSRALTIAGWVRPLDDRTHRLLIEWLDHRRARWPHTANRHLLISGETALRHGPVSATYILDLRGTPATL